MIPIALYSQNYNEKVEFKVILLKRLKLPMILAVSIFYLAFSKNFNKLDSPDRDLALLHFFLISPHILPFLTRTDLHEY